MITLKVKPISNLMNDDVSTLELPVTTRVPV